MLNKFKPNSFIGKGLSFPPSFDLNTGDILMVEGVEEISQSIHIILSTRPNERALELDFGANLEQLLFEPLDVSTIALAEDTISRALLFFEPRIEVNEITIDSEDIIEGKISIKIDFTIMSSNSRFNFVYPFYLKEATNITT